MVFHKPIQLLGAGVTLSIVGLGLALISGAITLRGYVAKSWPTTQATVVGSEVIVSKKASGILRRATVFSDYYTAKIEYEFTVDGKTIVGNEVGLGTQSAGFDRSVAAGVVAKYPRGTQITISYDRRKPENSMIDPNLNVAPWLAGIVVGLVSLIAGAVVWMKAIRLDEAQQAASQIKTSSVAAAPRVARTRLESVVTASVHDSPVQTVGVRVHWVLRTLSVLTGLAFLLVGSLALAACIRIGIPVKPGAAGPAPEALVAFGIVITIIGGMVLLGAFLVWIGMRRSTRRVKLPSPSLANQVTQPELNSPVTTPDFGAFIAQCGPQEAGLSHYLTFGAVLLCAGVLCLLAPTMFLQPKPADAAAVKGVLWSFGGLSLIGGFVMMWKPLFGQNHEILLYERGIIERVGGLTYRIALEEIEQLRVQEWYQHRFAPRTFNVRAKLRGERELSFSSALRGESERIITYLTQHVEKTELIPFQA